MAKTQQKKKFFKERTAPQIKKELELKNIFQKRGIVEKILRLNPQAEGVVVMASLVPNKFYDPEDPYKASRKWFKHGDLIFPSRPTSQEEAYRMRQLPTEALAVQMNKELIGVDEREIVQLGHGLHPVQGRDRRVRRIPFLYDLEGYKIFDYARGRTEGISVKPYDDALRVNVEGAEVQVKVPSRAEKKLRYSIRLSHVPTERKSTASAIITTLRSDFEEGRVPENVKLGEMRYTWEEQRKSSDDHRIAPHAITAYHGTAEHFLNEGNDVPLRMNPFIIPTQDLVNLHNLIANNLLVYDSTIGSKGGTRKPYQAERSNILAMGIASLGLKGAMQNPRRLNELPSFDWGK